MALQNQVFLRSKLSCWSASTLCTLFALLFNYNASQAFFSLIVAVIALCAALSIAAPTTGHSSSPSFSNLPKPEFKHFAPRTKPKSPPNSSSKAPAKPKAAAPPAPKKASMPAHPPKAPSSSSTHPSTPKACSSPLYLFQMNFLTILSWK
ncbi:hypothetical protein EV359DRAFT_83714 [Lentinula novae-zelandiae]|nr:hypothetical protein EV359DRAFT_83714 [Lentinula novae-zelandiae]